MGYYFTIKRNEEMMHTAQRVKHYVNLKKQVTEYYILFASIYMKYLG